MNANLSKPFFSIYFSSGVKPDTQTEIRRRIQTNHYSRSRTINANLIKISKKQPIHCYFSLVDNRPVITAFQFGRSALLCDDMQAETILSALDYLRQNGLSQADFF